MNLKKIDESKKNNTLSFEVSGTTEAFANAIRRAVIEEVPTLAIEDVEIKENSSALYDEMLALRLGLLPIKTDLKSYEAKEDCPCGGAGCAQCELVLTLKASKKGIVYASDMESKDPKCLPVTGEMPVIMLLAKQKVELQAVAVLGTGKKHAKWSPGLIWYRQKASLSVNPNSNQWETFKAKYPPQVLDKSGKIKKELIVELDLFDAVDGICDEVAKVEWDPTTMIFTCESWGQLSNQEILKKAAEMIFEKCEALEAQL